MANRDLFGGDYQRQPEKSGSAWASRMFLQGMVAVLLFAGVVALYEQESALGEGVRYVVALARADQQEALAVSSLREVDWQSLVEGLTGADVSDDEQGVPVAANHQDAENQAVQQLTLSASDETPVLVLPASGLMQAAFGDVGDDGLAVSGLQIFCQQEQTVKAAAQGEVTEAADGRLVLKHSGGLETAYTGALTPQVAQGDTVNQGQVIGRLPEGVLTFQVLVEGEPMDPLAYVLGPE